MLAAQRDQAQNKYMPMIQAGNGRQNSDVSMADRQSLFSKGSIRMSDRESNLLRQVIAQTRSSQMKNSDKSNGL